MKVIVCTDEKMGMSYNGRRQSQDSVICRNIVEMVGNGTIYLDPRSAELFEDLGAKMDTSGDYEKAGKDDYIFLEFGSAAEVILGYEAENVILYKWNRHYPADTFFDLFIAEWEIVDRDEFPGTSHELITKETFAP